MFEGTGIYFLILFLILFIVYLTTKVCLGILFKQIKIPAWKAYIPFYGTLILVDILEMKKSVFYKTLIPFVNLYYYKIIIAELLKVYNLNSDEAIWFIIIPMYKFPELVFKHPKFMLHMYDETEEFIVNQNELFESNQKEVKVKPNNYDQIPNPNDQTNNQSDEQNTVYFNKSLEPDERKETIIEAKNEKKKEEKPIIIDKSKPKVCPNCGTKLSPEATTCFLCGTKLL